MESRPADNLRIQASLMLMPVEKGKVEDLRLTVTPDVGRLQAGPDSGPSHQPTNICSWGKNLLRRRRGRGRSARELRFTLLGDHHLAGGSIEQQVGKFSCIAVGYGTSLSQPNSVANNSAAFPRFSSPQFPLNLKLTALKS
ncbi:hypothetical protein N657DRAFT_182266 [Parathielavia appendiculata]|uniref:Uncharacterized protein n=1 Tax=Parathielavia appendiculata TaxID=2587402 RepID=A0AAN6Z5Y9_9PEZI|nr:hypothetical protein N657DRAFT_182266 [Parathielavia appendiculata]